MLAKKSHFFFDTLLHFVFLFSVFFVFTRVRNPKAYICETPTKSTVPKV